MQRTEWHTCWNAPHQSFEFMNILGVKGLGNIKCHKDVDLCWGPFYRARLTALAEFQKVSFHWLRRKYCPCQHFTTILPFSSSLSQSQPIFALLLAVSLDLFHSFKVMSDLLLLRCAWHLWNKTLAWLDLLSWHGFNAKTLLTLLITRISKLILSFATHLHLISYSASRRSY